MTNTLIDFQKVEELRKYMRLTVSNVAELFDITRVTYYNWLKGKRPRFNQETKVRKVIHKLLAAVELGWPSHAPVNANSKERMEMLKTVLKMLDRPPVDVVV